MNLIVLAKIFLPRPQCFNSVKKLTHYQLRGEKWEINNAQAEAKSQVWGYVWIRSWQSAPFVWLCFWGTSMCMCVYLISLRIDSSSQGGIPTFKSSERRLHQKERDMREDATF